MKKERTEVFLIRHGEVEYPTDKLGRKLMYTPETELSEKGRKDVAWLANVLKGREVKFQEIYTSPYVRAVETAEILAGVLDRSEIVKDREFRDSDVSGWFGLPLSEIQKIMDEGEDIYDYPKSDDQETKDQIAKRTVERLKTIIKGNKNKKIALISHGDPLRLLVYRLENPKKEIPSMSILSKDGYLKRGEALILIFDNEEVLVDKELISNRKGKAGTREKYQD